MPIISLLNFSNYIFLLLHQIAKRRCGDALVLFAVIVSLKLWSTGFHITNLHNFFAYTAVWIYLTWSTLVFFTSVHQFCHNWSNSCIFGGFLSVFFSFPQVYSTQLGLFMPSIRLFSLQPRSLWGTAVEAVLHFLTGRPSPLGFFLAGKSIDQHLKLGPAPLSQLRGYRDLAVFCAHSLHYSLSPPALLATLAFWYNYD